jgi:hypothetical protein
VPSTTMRSTFTLSRVATVDSDSQMQKIVRFQLTTLWLAND